MSRFSSYYDDEGVSLSRAVAFLATFFVVYPCLCQILDRRLLCSSHQFYLTPRDLSSRAALFYPTLLSPGFR